jgi:hypothetical protein
MSVGELAGRGRARGRPGSTRLTGDFALSLDVAVDSVPGPPEFGRQTGDHLENERSGARGDRQAQPGPPRGPVERALARRAQGDGDAGT